MIISREKHRDRPPHLLIRAFVPLRVPDPSGYALEPVTLCGVNSVIGRRTTRTIVGRGILTARQIRFKTAAVMKKRMKSKKRFRQAVTVSELRTSLDRLERRSLITRVVASPRNTYFMVGNVDRDQMRKQVKEVIRARRTALRSEREKDRAFMKEDDSDWPLKGWPHGRQITTTRMLAQGALGARLQSRDQ